MTLLQRAVIQRFRQARNLVERSPNLPPRLSHLHEAKPATWAVKHHLGESNRQLARLPERQSDGVGVSVVAKPSYYNSMPPRICREGESAEGVSDGGSCCIAINHDSGIGNRPSRTSSDDTACNGTFGDIRRWRDRR